MNQAGYVELVMAKGKIRNWKALPEVKKEAIAVQIVPALDSVVNKYDFPWACEKATELTVVDQSEYVLKGNSKDCGEVINIRYGANALELIKLTPLQSDDMFSNVTIPTAVEYWVPEGFSGGYPKVRLIGTPATADLDILYRFRRKQLAITEVPEHLAGDMANVILWHLFPEDERLRGVALNSILSMIRNATRGGGEQRPARPDNTWRKNNQRRNNLYGY